MRTKKTRQIFAVGAFLALLSIPSLIGYVMDAPAWIDLLTGAAWGWFVLTDYAKALIIWINKGE